MSFIKTVAAVVAGAFLLTSPATAQQSLKFSTIVPDGSVWHRMMQNYAQLVAQYSNNELAVEIFPGGQLGAQDATLSQAVRGRIEIWGGAFPVLAAVKPELAPLFFPGMFESDAQANCVMPQMVEPTRAVLADVGHFVGFVPLGWQDLAAVNELTTMQDIVGQSIRSVPIPTSVALWRTLGLTPVAMDAAETTTALSTGMVTLVDQALSFWVASGQAELTPHFYPTHNYYSAGAVLIGNRTWEGFTDAQRAALDRAGDEGWNYAATSQVFAGFTARLSEMAAQRGGIIHEVSDEDRAWIRAAGETLWEPTLTQLGAGARAYFDAIQAAKANCPA